MRCLIILSSLFFAILCQQVYGEVQQVILIWWKPGLCGAPCVKNLYKQLGRVPGVSTVNIDQAAGRAYLEWKPDRTFSFQPLNAAVRYVGIRVDDIRLKVRGHIIQEAAQIKLVSSGDNTSFTLLNPVIPQPRQYVEQWNPAARKLSPSLQAQLLEIAKKGEVVTIEGQFFEPYRSPPNHLVVEQVSTEPGNKEPQKNKLLQ